MKSFIDVPCAYSALIQLDTASLCFAHLRNISRWCRFGCYKLGNTTSFIRQASSFTQTHNGLSQEVLDSSSLLREANTNVQTTEARLRSAQRLFVNDASVWPMHASRYYLRHDIHYSAVSGWAGALARVLAHSR
jgi:hypothetical protein